MSQKTSSSLLALAVLGILLITKIGNAAVYPCPSDPGFCYRDFGDDGCFDVGVDDGPINDEIEAQSTFPGSPDPGSIVCPPSVLELVATGGAMRLATATGSSILFYDA